MLREHRNGAKPCRLKVGVIVCLRLRPPTKEAIEMKTTARIPFAVVAALLLLLLTLMPAAPVTHANAPAVGPLDLSGELHGAPYRIRVPANWNGTLLVFAHGYRDKADHPGEIDNRSADVA